MHISKASLLKHRRSFLSRLGVAAGLGTIALYASPGVAQEADAAASGLRRRKSRRRDADILNFALNLEYLEAEYYLRATTGQGLDAGDSAGVGDTGEVVVPDDTTVPFRTEAIAMYANEIAADELAHVRFLRGALGPAAVARPAINLREAFTAAAAAAGLIQQGQTFDPFADEQSFLLGAFLFEDVGVTAYSGAAPLLLSPDVLAAAAGILAVEAYHASNVRTVLFNLGAGEATEAISDARDSLDGNGDMDQGVLEGVGDAGAIGSNIVPADENAIAFARTPEQVLNIVYLNPNTQPGGFFPQGVNGQIK